MKDLLFATSNLNKARELEGLTAGLPVRILTLKDFPDLVSPPETGTTFQENALIKARAATAATGLWALADDSGLTVDALNGEPGVYSARYSGPKADANSNNAKLLKAMANVMAENRQAQFRAVLALTLPQGEEYYSEGVTAGEILREYRGNNGFGYDPLFYLPQLGKTMAELSLAEKNQISHRAKAFQGILDIIKSLL